MMARAVEIERAGAISVECRRDFVTVSDKSVQVLRPVGESPKPEPLDGPSLAMPPDKTPRGEDVVLRACADEGERDRPERELEEPASERRDVVVVALGRGLGDDLDLAAGKPEAPVQLGGGRVLRLGAGQIEPRRAGFEDHVAMLRIGDLA